jgi:hypothetical protein
MDFVSFSPSAMFHSPNCIVKHFLIPIVVYWVIYSFAYARWGVKVSDGVVRLHFSFIMKENKLQQKNQILKSQCLRLSFTVSFQVKPPQSQICQNIELHLQN